jgi:hypothetical protein
MTDVPSDQGGYEVSTELYGEFRGRISDDVIRGCVRAAMTDLHGSISCEALPEMAVRLARVRLAALAPVARSSGIHRAATGPITPVRVAGTLAR